LKENVEAILKICELFLGGDMHCITNSFRKYEQKQRRSGPNCELHFK